MAEPNVDKWEFMNPEEREVAALSKKLDNLMMKLQDTWEESKEAKDQAQLIKKESVIMMEALSTDVKK